MKFLKFKMNKRGEEESSSTGAIIAAVIAAVVLVLVIIGLYLWFSGSGLPFASYLPGFNQTKPPVVDMEILRYSIANDKVQYYDGTKWNDFSTQGSVEMNGKTIYYYPKNGYSGIRVYLLYNFISLDSRWDWHARGPGLLLSPPRMASLPDIQYATPVWYYPGDWIFVKPVNAWIWLFSSSENDYQNQAGDMRLVIKAGTEGKVLGRYVIHLANSMIKLNYNNDGTYKNEENVDLAADPLLRTARDLAVEWRDSFLDKPAKVTYFDANNEPHVIYVCYNRDRYKIDRDLQVNLANAVAADAKC